MDADNYREITDHATTYKYELKSQKTKVNSLTKKAKNNNTYFLAWSTTPWNKIVTPALAVNPKLTYVKVKQKEEFYILAKPTLRILEGKYEVVEEFTGEQLIGMEFVPHYDYYRTKIDKDKKAFVVIGGDFVTADEGTGIVTLAAYGEEDLKVMLENDVHIEMHLDEEGNIKNDVPQFGGMYYLKANKYVNEDLKKRGLIYKDEMIPHNVPLCWRCHTRLYHAPQDAWYVDIQKLKPLLKKTNEYVNWFPKHFKHGRFLKSLESAPDWNISRSRYWGSPVPVWECSCGERFVPGSIKELEDASGQKITELHKPEIDEIKITCKKCGQKVKRVPEVLDSWIEAGSASFAERHFPFNKQEKLEDFFPPDFIAEYTGQIRAWFYVLHVIGAALYSSPAFKNVLVEGVILGTDGRKMSKNYGNYPDPKELLLKYGGDALRLYLLSSPVMNGEDIIISEERYKNQIRGMMLILWNVYNFFVTYANVDRWEPKELSFEKDYFFNEDVKKNVLDRWIIVLLNRLIRDVTNALENFDTVMAVTNLQHFVNDLSTWYIRRSRERVGPTAQSEDIKVAFYETCFYVLTTFCRISAPIMPFLSEFIYRNLTGEESVHLTAWPVWSRKNADDRLEAEMSFARKVVELAHAQRKAKGIMLRQPLISLKTVTPIKLSDQILAVIKDEVNVKKVTNDVGEAIEAELDFRRSKELEEEGVARGIIR
jgi:isoleucyl-tRNA synthetase